VGRGKSFALGLPTSLYQKPEQNLVTTVEELQGRGVGLGAARARGQLSGRPRKMDVTMLRMAMGAMADRETSVHDLAKRLGITTTTLYMYVNSDGSVKEPGQKLLNAVQDA